MRVIVLSGKAQHGKDATAKFLKQALEADGHRVLLTHYADLLKYMCRQFFGWDGQKNEQGRHILQYVGTDVIRQKNPDFWVDFIISVINLFPDEWDYVLIPDCRFPNEIERLREEGIDTIHLRVSRDNFVSSLSKEQQAHPSEVSLDGVTPDYYIDNAGSLKDLQKVIADWLVSVNGFHQMTFDESCDDSTITVGDLLQGNTLVINNKVR